MIIEDQRDIILGDYGHTQNSYTEREGMEDVCEPAVTREHVEKMSRRREELLDTEATPDGVMGKPNRSPPRRRRATNHEPSDLLLHSFDSLPTVGQRQGW